MILTLLKFLLSCGMLVTLVGRTTAQGPPTRDGRSNPRGDEFRVILRDIEDAYRAPADVEREIGEQLRRAYRDPRPDREARIFREIHRRFTTTPELDEAILREIRRSYDEPTPEQQERVFNTIRRAEALPMGSVPALRQSEQAARMFGRLDQDRSGTLGVEEMSDVLQEQRARWDSNRDGLIDQDEYSAYVQDQFKSIGASVASGEIPIRLPRGVVLPAPASVDATRSAAKAAEKEAPLPDWFTEFDADGDGQVGLYEWRKTGREIKDFLAMDDNADGFLVADELRKFLARKTLDR